MITLQTPYVQFTELDGSPLDDGAVYIGTAGLNPQTNPITVYWDNAGTQPAAQPLATRSGVIARNGAPARVYISASSYSLMVRDKRGSLVASELTISASVDASGITDGTITESKLDAPTAAKINGALQKSGGTMTGSIVLPGNATNALEAVPKQQLDATVRSDLSPLSVTVSGSALTCVLPAEVLTFRSTTLSDGAVFSRTASATSLTVPAGATLGTANGAPARLVWGLIDNAGTPEPFVVNVGGTANLDETTLISTTAISGSANSANTFYSQIARSNVAFRIRGWCDITEATAGIWATAPTKVQGASIQSMRPIQGRGRVPQNMMASRTFGVTYYNTAGYEIFVHVNIQWTSGSGAARLTVDGVAFDGGVISASTDTSQVNVPVPPGGAYTFNGTNSIGFSFFGWNESR